MYTAIKDTNTGYVYDWIKTFEDGSSTSINLPPELWKIEQEWSLKEIDALFDEPVNVLFDEPSVDQKPENVKPKKNIINRIFRR